jgi:hypothetical protein
MSLSLVIASVAGADLALNAALAQTGARSGALRAPPSQAFVRLVVRGRRAAMISGSEPEPTEIESSS